MISRRSDLPLDTETHGRYLPWIIAFMVFLAALALAGMLVLDSMVGRWDADAGATLTVQVPPSADAEADTRRVTAAMTVIEATEGVLHARVLGRDGLLALLEPWLGAAGAADDLPLPRLIDVELDGDASVDVEALGRRVAAAAPGASIDDHRVWLDRLVRLVRAVEVLALLATLLMAVATVGTVIFTTRTGLAIHHDAIEVLHLIGAHDDYVARQFAARALFMGLRGGAIGIALAAPTLLVVDGLAARLEAGLLPDLSLSVVHWVAIALLPVVAAVIAMVTARLTVTRTLAGMP
jgi:cell division transport system permease protein